MSVKFVPESDLGRRNLELKVRVPDQQLEVMGRTVLERARTGLLSMRQDDRYFSVPEGRLKLRIITSDDDGPSAELISYRRLNAAESRWSAYHLTRLDPDRAEDLASTLELVMPVWARVRKQRWVAIVGATRVHLDRVERLGDFIELETVVTIQSDADAQREHQEITEWLGLNDLPVVAGSYSDLLQQA